MKYRKSFIILFITLAFGLNLFGQKQTPPEGSKPKDFKLPQKSMITLKNGLTASLAPFGTLPKVTISVIIRSGNLNEKENEVWLADIFGDLLKEGTKTLSAKAVAEKASGMGGSINVNVGMDITTISGDVLSEFGPDLVKLLADIIRNPLIPEAELARIKNDRLRSLNMNKVQPNSMASKKFRALLYPDHPYGRLYPSEEMLKGYTIDQIREYYKNNFGALRTKIYVSGVFDKKSVEKAIRESFDSWEKGPEPLINVPKTTAKKQFALVDRPNSTQSVITLGLPVINPADKEYIKLLVTNTILGGSFTSRITSNIRERKGYTYSPNSQVSVRYRDAYWAEIASVGTDVTGAALKEIFYEINTLKNEAPPADELKAVQSFMAGTFVLQNSTPAGIIGQMIFLDLHGLKDTYLTEYVKNIYSVTPKDVQQTMQNIIRDKDMTLVVVGDQKKIESQLEPYSK
jgi:zinc protease